MDLGTYNGVFQGYNSGFATGISNGLNTTGVEYGLYNPRLLKNEIIRDGLVIYLDASNVFSYSGSGQLTLFDLTGNGYNGTLTNGPTYNNLNGGNIRFDGVNDLISHNNLDAGTVCSYGVWINYNTLSGEQVILGSNITNYYSLFYYNATKDFGVNFGGSGTYYKTLRYSTGLNINTWYNIFYVRNGATIEVFINGYSIGNIINVPNFSTIFRIIGNERLTSPFPFSGNISNVLVYNRILSAAEVLQNYNATRARFFNATRSNFGVVWLNILIFFFNIFANIMEDTFKALLLMMTGVIIPTVWKKYLFKKKEDIDIQVSKTDDCQKNIDILKGIIEELRAEIERLKSSMINMRDVNQTHEAALKDQIRKLIEVNNDQSNEITGLKVKIADMAIKINAFEKKSAPKKGVRKAVA